MKKRDKAKFIRSLCNGVRDDALKSIEHMPEDWDGIELREYLAGKFVRESLMGLRPAAHRARLKAFRNVVATKMGL